MSTSTLLLVLCFFPFLLRLHFVLQVWLWISSWRTVSSLNLAHGPACQRLVSLSQTGSPRTMSSLLLRAWGTPASSCLPLVRVNAQTQTQVFVSDATASECCVFNGPSAGVKNADENELHSIASEPDEGHVYNVADFSVMSSIVEGLTRTVCEQVEQQDKDIKESKVTTFILLHNLKLHNLSGRPWSLGY